MTAEPSGAAVRAATALARVLLRRYPSSFRKDVGNALVDDVRRRARDLAGSQMGVRSGLWLIRLAISLLTNALAAWVEKLPLPGASWLDVKLAVRMLFRQPGLTLVAGDWNPGRIAAAARPGLALTAAPGEGRRDDRDGPQLRQGRVERRHAAASRFPAMARRSRVVRGSRDVAGGPLQRSFARRTRRTPTRIKACIRPSPRASCTR